MAAVQTEYKPHMDPGPNPELMGIQGTANATATVIAAIVELTGIHDQMLSTIDSWMEKDEIKGTDFEKMLSKHKQVIVDLKANSEQQCLD